jgi:dolichol-phosphate mannosyltransferase
VATFPHCYSIHGLLTVASTVGLPELEPFRLDRPLERADIQVRIGRVQSPTGAPATPQHIVYDEGWWPMGFQCRIDLDDSIEVTASSLLALSPHVLYTNVVEPILRWTFAGRGYTLVHGACLAWGQSAYLITALTDTGKTTTVLQLLAHSQPSDPAAFISDDLTLLSPEGKVYTFPKPLTISAHTLHAIDAGQLDWQLRLFLPLQSMVHSRGGRRTAHRMARLPLPVATINAVTQMLVPPPKYPVQALVPTVKMASTAQLAGIFFIEWGADADLRLLDDEALGQLMRNGDDAYGFPPYAAIAPSLYQSPAGDLRVREREIVEAALRGLPKRLIRREHGEWWRYILADLSASPEAAADDPGRLEWSGQQTSSPPA